jgi:hypothetical protein
VADSLRSESDYCLAVSVVEPEYLCSDVTYYFMLLLGRVDVVTVLRWEGAYTDLTCDVSQILSLSFSSF